MRGTRLMVRTARCSVVVRVRTSEAQREIDSAANTDLLHPQSLSKLNRRKQYTVIAFVCSAIFLCMPFTPLYLLHSCFLCHLSGGLSSVGFCD